MTTRRRLLLAAGLGLAGAAASAHQTLEIAGVRLRRPKIDPLPAVALTTMGGERRRLDEALRHDAPLVLNFVFTTCSTSCSLQTAMLAQAQRQLVARGLRVQIASITIDPDNDTPEQLQRFARGFGIGAGWEFYTGRFDDLLRVQRHFDVYRGSKAAHPPVLMLRRDGRAPWLRVEGFPSAAELIRLLETLPDAT